MFSFAVVLLSEHLLEPMSLVLSGSLVYECGIVTDDKFLAASVTPKSTHLLKAGRPLSHLTLLDGYCSHRWETFYLGSSLLNASLLDASLLNASMITVEISQFRVLAL